MDGIGGVFEQVQIYLKKHLSNPESGRPASSFPQSMCPSISHQETIVCLSLI